MKLKMTILIIFLEWLILVICSENGNFTVSHGTDLVGDKNEKILSRRKRYVVFPKGASLQLVYCNTYLLRPIVDIFRYGTTVGLAWQLPHDPEIFKEHKKKHKIYKRNVFKKMEAFLGPGEANGQQCVLKALCESGQRTPSKKEFVVEILHTIFSANHDEFDEEDTPEDKMYKKAHNSTNQNCETLYPDCQFSIFNMFK